MHLLTDVPMAGTDLDFSYRLDHCELTIARPAVSRMEYLLELRISGGTWLPRLRAAQLGPGASDRWYSANPGYARALGQHVIPAINARVATKARIGIGASLGALAMLHAHCRYPDSFDALFLAVRQLLDRMFPRRVRPAPDQPDRPVNACGARLWSDGIGAHGTVVRYHHRGRPVLVFPSDHGKAFDLENNGMAGAVAHLVDAGRLKLYCADSYDSASWSDKNMELEERARQHAVSGRRVLTRRLAIWPPGR
ncbi:MAG TPA: hypothetical protein VFQ44_16685 [Streptosporangiaceae bacterium]|nr:hypothetical protein [Streptosporangiaceae bacterium]